MSDRLDGLRESGYNDYEATNLSKDLWLPARKERTL
jgi:hypothetical protein